MSQAEKDFEVMRAGLIRDDVPDSPAANGTDWITPEAIFLAALALLALFMLVAL